MTKRPTVAILLVLVNELLCYYPTVRKCYLKPEEENVASWLLAALRWICATIAVSHVTFNAIVYPAFDALCDTLVVLYIVYRKKAVGRNPR